MADSGLILFNKPSSLTSFDALRDIKKSLGTGKVGHTGTLDKFACGLLIVLAGKALRLSQWFTHLDKKYIGKIRFGEETDTLDPEGQIIANAPLPTRQQVEDALPQFTGEIMQAPPVYSAIHINGKRASSLARSGQEIEMKKRPVTIYNLELLSWEPPFAEIFVHCSSGTYIRSLARDLAILAGSRAHLCELKRLEVGGFKLEKTEKNEGLKLIPITREVIKSLGMAMIDVTSEDVEYIKNGKPLNKIFNNKTIIPPLPPRPGGNSSVNPFLALFYGEEIAAIIQKTPDSWKYSCVLT